MTDQSGNCHYTDIEGLAEKVAARREDEAFMQRLSDFLGGDIPEQFKSTATHPMLMACTVPTARQLDCRYAELAKQAGFQPVWAGNTAIRYFSNRPEVAELSHIPINADAGRILVDLIEPGTAVPGTYLTEVPTFSCIGGKHLSLVDTHLHMRYAAMDISDAESFADMRKWFANQVHRLKRDGVHDKKYFDCWMALATLYPLVGDLTTPLPCIRRSKDFAHSIRESFTRVTTALNANPLIVNLPQIRGDRYYPRAVAGVLK